jgi:hypothetical protein
MQKSGEVIHPVFRLTRYQGQVPSREAIEAQRLVQKKPPRFQASMLLDHTEPVLRIDGITKGLGLDPAREQSWNKFLDENLNGGINDLVMRKALYSRMIEERMEPELRRALFQRAMNYKRDAMRKSMFEIWTPEQILEKAEARGGTYHRRIPRKNGKGFTYIYDSEKYDGRADAHLSGADARDARIKKALDAKLTEAGKKGCKVDDMKELAKKYGGKEVAAVLKKQCGEGGPMSYKSGRFYMVKSLPPTRFVLGVDL